MIYRCWCACCNESDCKLQYLQPVDRRGVEPDLGMTPPETPTVKGTSKKQWRRQETKGGEEHINPAKPHEGRQRETKGDKGGQGAQEPGNSPQNVGNP